MRRQVNSKTNRQTSGHLLIGRQNKQVGRWTGKRVKRETKDTRPLSQVDV